MSLRRPMVSLFVVVTLSIACLTGIRACRDGITIEPQERLLTTVSSASRSSPLGADPHQPEHVGDDATTEAVAASSVGSRAAKGGELSVISAVLRTPQPGAEVAFLVTERGHVDENVRGTRSELLRRAFSRGRVFTADARGKVQLPPFSESALIAARAGSETGVAQLFAMDGSWTLEVSAQVRVSAVVCDAAGVDSAGVRVCLLRRHDLGVFEEASAVTSDDGVVEFLIDADGANDLRTLSAALPFARGPSAQVDLHDLPDEPIRLVLPPAGRVRCEVDSESGPASVDGEIVLLRAVGSESDLLDWHSGEWKRLGEARVALLSGVAIFPFVGLGLELEVEAPDLLGERVTATTRFAGPIAVGEEIIVRLKRGGRRPTIVGRLVDERGLLLTGVVLRGGLVEAGHRVLSRRELMTTTDAAGRFRFALERLPIDSRRVAFEIRKGTGSMRIAAVELLYVAPAAEVDVGDVVYRLHALVSGCVVDSEGSALADANVRVTGVNSSDDVASDSDSWRNSLEVVSDGSGRFLVEGDPARVRRVRVSASCEGYFCPDVSEFTSGASDVRVLMRVAGGVAGRIRQPSIGGTRGVVVKVGGERVFVDNDGRFAVRTVRPGLVRVEIESEIGADTQRVAFDDVEVVAGELSRDPRLQEVDLMQSAKSFVVTIADELGRPIRDATLSWRPGLSDERWRYVGRSEADGNVTVTAPAGEFSSGGFDLLVVAPGCSPTEKRRVSSDLTISVAAIKTSVVTVRLSSNTELPGPLSEVSARLRWAGSEVAGERRSSLFGDPRDTTAIAFDSDRVARFPACAPGTYDVEVSVLTRTERGFSWRVIRTVPGTVTIAVSADGAPIDTMLGVDPDDLAGAK